MSEFVTLGNHISIQKGKAPLETGYSGIGAKPYLNPEYLRGRAAAELAKPGADAIHARDGDTILLWDGSNAGEFFKAKSGLVASTMARITPSARFNTRYFVHVAKHAETYLKSQTNGTGIPHVDRELLEAIRVFCPEPAEQLRLAEILDTLDIAIFETAVVVAKLKDVKQGLLHDLLTRGIDANGELRPPQLEAPHLYKKSPLGWIPKAWDAVELNQLVDPRRPVVYGILMPGYGWPGGIPVVKVKDIVDGQIQQDGLLLTSPQIDREYSRSRLIDGDLLFTIRGTVGRTAFVPVELAGANITQDSARLSIHGIDPRFVRAYLSSPIATKFISVHTLGVAVQGINLRDVRRIPIAKPIGDEPREIADRLEAISARLADESKACEKLRLKKIGLMDDLLTGRVRVTSLLNTNNEQGAC
jgi:type I restriction enzyme, S subunit